MLDAAPYALTLACALGSGLIAGAFFAFSTFIMKALVRLPAPHGIAAMQSINIVVINPMFLSVFLGTAAACVLLFASALARWSESGSEYVLTGSVVYFVGTFIVTMRCNVPRNNALAAVDPVSAEGAAVWTRYLAEWTAWNHVRTSAALAATAAFIVAFAKGWCQ